MSDEQHVSPFEQIRHETEEGGEYWSARELSKVLGYSDWRNFVNAIVKAREACENSGHEVADHFVDVTDMIEIGKGAKREIEDVHLSRYACYLVVQNTSSSLSWRGARTKAFSVTVLADNGFYSCPSAPGAQVGTRTRACRTFVKFFELPGVRVSDMHPFEFLKIQIPVSIAPRTWEEASSMTLGASLTIHLGLPPLLAKDH